ncbi:MAG: cytochrome c biogenesis protein ResB [Bdellovibrionales bacterium]|nr:cytochrome c biogenesis protein ResB [Bdellovibrionales bacterium]
MIWNQIYRLFRFLASLELAVVLILLLAAALSVGTVYESKYSAQVASVIVYRSLWMQILLWLFVTNLAAAAFSRLPWRRHHTGFLVTHLGIIILLVGAFLTQRFGVDGSMSLASGEKGRHVFIEEDRLNLYRATAGESYELLLTQKLQLHPLREFKDPVTFVGRSSKGEEIPVTVLNYYPKARRVVDAAPSKSRTGVPALKFRMSGSRGSAEEWVFLQNDVGGVRDVGPARLRFQKARPVEQKVDRPTLYLWTSEAGLELFSAHPTRGFRRHGKVKVGKPVPIEWMDFQFVVDQYIPRSEPTLRYFPLDSRAEGLPQVAEVEIRGERAWVELGSAAQLAMEDGIYYIQYSKRQVDVGFELALKDFRIDYYEGSSRPKEYSSLVEAGGVEHVISMNEPLKHNGFTFYQASYQSDEEGKPVASVFSVNLDPGRWVKYLGSFMLCMGIMLMFWFKPRYSGTSRFLKRGDSPS